MTKRGVQMQDQGAACPVSRQGASPVPAGIGAVAVGAALMLCAPPVYADPQSQAMITAINACLSTSIAAEKRARAMTGFAPQEFQSAHFTHHAWGNTLSYPPVGFAPFPLAGPSLMELLPGYQDYVSSYGSETRWLAEQDGYQLLVHPSGWHVILEADGFDTFGGYCTLWHPAVSEDTQAELDRMAGYFTPHPMPFVRVVDLTAWRTQGIYDFDQTITILYPDQSLLPETAGVYVLTNIFAYDLTEEY